MIATRFVVSPEDLARLRQQPERLRRALRVALAWALNDARDHAREVGLGGGSGRLTSRRGEAGLRGSITTQMGGEGDRQWGALGSNLVYAAIHELGGRTRPHEIRPRRGRALRWLGRDGMVFARRVRHPGSVIPARPYLRPAIEHALERLQAAHMPAALTAEGLS
jgi:phage gpG-like protein